VATKAEELAELKELQQALKDLDALDAEEAQTFAATQTKTKTDAPEEQSFLSKAFRGLQIPGDLLATGVGEITEAISRQITPESPLKILSPEQRVKPGVEGFLGIGKKDPITLGQVLEKSGATPEGVGGEILEGLATVTADPLNVASGGAAAVIPKGKIAERGIVALKNILKAPSSGAKRLGEAMFGAGIKPALEVAQDAGKAKQLVVDTFIKHNITGTGAQVRQKALKILPKLRSKADNLMAEATANGAKVDLEEAFRPFNDQVAEMINSGVIDRDFASKTFEKLFKNWTPERATPTNVAKWKTSLNRTIKQMARKTDGDVDAFSKLKFAASKGFKEGVENAVDLALPNKAGVLKGINAERGVLLSSRKGLQRLSKKSKDFSILPSQGDLAILAGGQVAGVGGPAAAFVGVKKGAQLLGSTNVKTRLGKGLKEAGEGGDLFLGAPLEQLASKLPQAKRSTALLSDLAQKAPTITDAGSTAINVGTRQAGQFLFSPGGQSAVERGKKGASDILDLGIQKVVARPQFTIPRQKGGR